MAELQQESQPKKLHQLNNLLKIGLLGSLVILIILAKLAMTTWNAAQTAEIEKQKAIINEIQALTESSAVLFNSGKIRDAVVQSMKAGEKLQLVSSAKSESQIQTVLALQKALDSLRKKKLIEVNTLISQNGEIKNIIYSPDGKLLAHQTYQDYIKIWDASTGKVLNTIKGPWTSTFFSRRSLVFSPDGKLLADTRGDNETIRIWDIKTGKVLINLKGHQDKINSLIFSPDGKQLASGGDDKTIKIWDFKTGKVLTNLEGHQDKINSLIFSPDGKQLASASCYNTIKTWNVNTGKVLNTISFASDTNKSDSLIDQAIFSPDGTKLAVAHTDETKTIKIWDAKTGKLLTNLTDSSVLVNGKRSVNSLDFSPNGELLVDGEWHNMRVWDVSTGKVLINIRHDRDVSGVIFSPDGKQLASASEEETIKIWDVNTDVLTNASIPENKNEDYGKKVNNDDENTSGSNPNLDDLLVNGCSLLKNYLIAHPQELEKLKYCQNLYKNS